MTPLAPPKSRRSLRYATATISFLLVGSEATATRPASALTVSKVAINTVVMTTLPVFEFNTFFSPAAVVISCEIDHNFRSPGAPTINQAYCMSTTAKYTHHATLSANGVVKRCVGAQCGSNPGLGTPSLSPGTEVVSGPFTCVISANTVTCTLKSAKGFVFSARAISTL
jgi:hypothetical protein